MKRMHDVACAETVAAEYRRAETIITAPFHRIRYLRRFADTALTGLWRGFASGHETENGRAMILVFFEIIVLGLFIQIDMLQRAILNNDNDTPYFLRVMDQSHPLCPLCRA